jgi:PKD repeat protein
VSAPERAPTAPDPVTKAIRAGAGAPDGSSSSPCPLDMHAYKAWCTARGPNCVSLVDLPGENNNSAEDAAIASWIVHTVGFQPTYWSIGNEPMLWSHYGIPWNRWQSSDASTPTPLAYAWDVHAAIAAVKAVDPGARFIGIQADCECQASWFQQTVSVNGPNLSAIAYHTYPSTALSQSVSLSQFLDPLTSSANITTSYQTVRNDIAGWCSDCSTLPIFVDEYNAGPGWGPSNYGGSYANALFLAASTVQALRANVSQFMIFNLQTASIGTFGYSMLDGQDTIAPTGLLYSSFLRDLATGTVYGSSLASGVGNVWSVVTENATHRSLLIVNANLTQSVTVAPSDVLPSDPAARTDTWSSGAAAPSTAVGPLPDTLTVPAQGMALLTTVRPSIAPLTVNSSADPARGIGPLEVSFASALHGGDELVSALWGFGDGATGAGLNATHVYMTPGNYTANLSVQDAAGQTASVAVPVEVLAPPRGWIVDAWANVTAGTAPLPVLFSATAREGTPPYSFSWSFGNGGSSSEAVASTTYAHPGNYTAVLTVVDGIGNRTNVSVPIFVAEPVAGVSAWALASATSGPSPLSVVFLAEAEGSAGGFNYTWQSGPGAPAIYGPSATFVFAHTGTYTVGLAVRAVSGLAVLLSIPVHVFPPLTIALTPPAAPLPLGTPVELSAASSGGLGPDTYFWSVNGSLLPVRGNALVWRPPGPGVYFVTVTAYDAVGDQAVATSQLLVLRVGGGSSGPVPPGPLGLALGGLLLAASLAIWPRFHEGDPAELATAARRLARRSVRRLARLGRSVGRRPRSR